MVPSGCPPAPPLPIPHPFVGYIFDAMEYIPITIPLPIPFVGVVPIPLSRSTCWLSGTGANTFAQPVATAS